MTISPQQALVHKIGSQDNLGRPQLATVNVSVTARKSTAVATDSYRLLAVTRPIDGPDESTIYDASAVERVLKIAKITKASEVELVDASRETNYPNWQAIKPDLAKAYKVKLDRKLLIGLLQAMDTRYVDLSVCAEELKPLVVTASESVHEYYGLLMPLRS